MDEAQGSGPESIGQRLRRLRLERQLSQRELSSPGVSYAYISRIEAGARRPSVKALRQLAPNPAARSNTSRPAPIPTVAVNPDRDLPKPGRTLGLRQNHPTPKPNSSPYPPKAKPPAD